MKPPKIRKINPIISAPAKDWDDGFAVNHEIPKYKVAEDKHAQGYISGLQKQRRLKHYLNMVYSNASKERQQGLSKSPMTRQVLHRDASIDNMKKKENISDADALSLKSGNPQKGM